MEQIITWNSPKRNLIFFSSLLALFILLCLANLEDPSVQFTDPNLELLIREKIGQSSAPIYQTGLLSITELDASGRNIISLQGIECLKKLVVLNLQDNNVDDLTPLANLEYLSDLNLQNNQITNLDDVNFEQLIKLPLHSLNLSNNVLEDGSRLSDIALLGQVSTLEILDLQNNQVVDIEPVSHLGNLSELNVKENQITDITSIGMLDNLVYLNIHSNPINNGLDSISKLNNLRTLIMRNVNIGENFHFLSHLTKLQKLNIRNTAITDVSILGDLMADGVLQDNTETGVSASIDLLENVPEADGIDPYKSLRKYWNNISVRYPIDLPFYSSEMSSPEFSNPSGFYENDFQLTLINPNQNGTIFYTLDGSEPIVNQLQEPLGTTLVYQNPIMLNNQYVQPGILSNINIDQWILHSPQLKSFNGTMLRAVIVDDLGNQSEIVTNSYFIDEKIKSRFSIPLISIGVNNAYLFDDELGIYSNGDTNQEENVEEPGINTGNYSQHGLKWERPISFELFNTEGKLLFSQNIGIRIHGGYSRDYHPRSLRLIASDLYDEHETFQYNFFPELNDRLHVGEINTFETLILRNGGNDTNGTMLRDVLAQSLLESTQLDIQGSKPVIVYINGEYWGLYSLRSRYDELYFKTQYDINNEDLLVLTYVNGWPIVKLGDYRKQATHYQNLFSMIDINHDMNGYSTSTSLSDETAYNEISNKIDISNFITYFAAQIYFNNVDWPRNNMMLWTKTITAPNDVNTTLGQDGKWRWMMVDEDFSFGNPNQDNLSRILIDIKNEPSTYIFRALLENKEFKHQFISQFADYLNTIFREEVVIKKTDELELLYAPEIQNHINRWGTPAESLDSWLENVETIRTFAQNRPTIQREQIIKYFNLPGSAKINLQANPTQGYIRINTIEIIENEIGVEDSSNWSGIYFQEVPVELVAIAKDGYKFTRWEGGEGQIPDPYLSSISINMETDLQIKAVFELDK